MNKPGIIISLFTFVLFTVFVKGNDSTKMALNNYGRVFINQLPDNPSMTSIEGHYNINACYGRNTIVQNKGLSNFNAFISIPIGKRNIVSLGQNYSYSGYYFYKSNFFNTAIALHFVFKNGFAFHWGSSLNINYMKISINNIYVEDIYDPTLYYLPKSMTTFSMTHSFTLSYNKLFWSLTKNPENKIIDLFQNYIISYVNPFQYKYISSAGYHFALNDKIDLLPVILWKFDYGSNNLFSPIVFLNYNNKYLFGISWENLNSLTIYGGAVFMNIFHITGNVTVPLENNNDFYYPVTKFNLGLQYAF